MRLRWEHYSAIGEPTLNKKKKILGTWITRADLVLLAAFCLAGVLFIVIPLAGNQKDNETDAAGAVSSGPYVVIYTGDTEYGRYPLNEDQTITVTQVGSSITDTKTNVVTIKDGKACMESSTCENQICVETGWISKENEIIVCLPNRVYVTIEDETASSDGDTEMDAVAR